ncbi:delta(1)-pyrroline-2-carboxylate reductase family protein [Alcaligenaceae bacterium]|nr:delta(1)-pyrroline-2-carboxylate reductase family protein [Alcaligenaceae bacterium]
MNTAITVYNATQTAQLLPFPELVQQLALACTELSVGKIHAPERQVVNFPHGGVMLSMPATAPDIGIHKLVNVMHGNAALGLPTIHGVVSAYDGQTGRELFVLDGPTVTARRTAALSMLGLQTFLAGAPQHIAFIGCGTQASGHAAALAALYPGIRISVVARQRSNGENFIQAHQHLALQLETTDHVPDSADVVITLTTSSTPVYTLAAQVNRLIIGVGAFKPELAEISALTLEGSVLYTDDLPGARHEAGDFIQAGIDWDRVIPLANALYAPPKLQDPIVFKTVGCAAWDLGAVRCAYAGIQLAGMD